MSKSPLLTIVCVLLPALLAAAGEIAESRKPPLKSGLKPGDEVGSFYTRAVTGPLMNRSVCYVCRNGQRPVVMILLRRIDPELKPLMQRVDRLVDRNRAIGLRGFGVLIGDDSRQATSAVQTFAFDNRISLPLTIAGETVAAAGNPNVSREAAVTVVLYRKLKVVQSWSFRHGELRPVAVKAIAKRIERFATKSAANEDPKGSSP